MTRLHSITEKIPRQVTGLKSNLFVHVDYDNAGKVDSIRFSEKKKDGNTLDKILIALGDAATGIIRSLPGGAQ